MPWNTPSGPRYAPPMGVAGTLAGGLASMGDRLAQFAMQKRESERQAMLDQRDNSRWGQQVDWRNADIARDDEDAMANLRARGWSPSMGDQIASNVGSPQLAANGPIGDRIFAEMSPPAPARQTMNYRGQTLAFDPATSEAGMLDAAERERAETQRRELVAALTPITNTNYGERGGAMADVISRGVNPSNLAYTPLGRDDQIDYARDEANATRGPVAPVNRQFDPETGAIFDPASGSVTYAPGRSGSDGAAPRAALPIWAQQAVSSNTRQLGVIDDALRQIASQPDAVGFWRGRSDAIDQRVNPLGVPARAAISDIGSLVIKDRSGASVTAIEFPRIAPFVPSPRDTPATVKIKLERMRQIIEDENLSISGGGAGADSSAVGPTRQNLAGLESQRSEWDQLASQHGREQTERAIGPRP